MDLVAVFFSCFAVLMCLAIGGIARDFGAFKKCSYRRKPRHVLPVPVIAPIYTQPTFTTLRPPTPAPPEPTPIQEAKAGVLAKIVVN